MEKVRREKMQVREKVGVASHCVLPMIWGPGGSKSILAKAAGAKPAGQMRDEKVHAVVREAHFQVKKVKAPHVRTTFGSWAVEKAHAIVARSTFPSQNGKSTTCSDPFWTFRCRKSARRCGAKHISKSKVSKTNSFRPLLEVQMSEKCTSLWREAHFQVKMEKNTTCSDHFWTFRCRKRARRCGAKHISKSNV